MNSLFGSKLKRRKQDERDLKTMKGSVRGLLKITCQFLDYVNGIIDRGVSPLRVNIEDVMTLMSFSTMMKSYINIYVTNKFARPGLMFSIEHIMTKIDESISSIREALIKMHEYALDDCDSMSLITDQVLEIGKSFGEIKSYLRMMSLSIHTDNVRIDCDVDIIQEYYDNIKNLKKFYSPTTPKYTIQFTNENIKKEK